MMIGLQTLEMTKIDATSALGSLNQNIQAIIWNVIWRGIKKYRKSPEKKAMVIAQQKRLHESYPELLESLVRLR